MTLTICHLIFPVTSHQSTSHPYSRHLRRASANPNPMHTDSIFSIIFPLQRKNNKDPVSARMIWKYWRLFTSMIHSSVDTCWASWNWKTILSLRSGGGNASNYIAPHILYSSLPLHCLSIYSIEKISLLFTLFPLELHYFPCGAF